MSGEAKHVAGISLGVMATGFVATLPFPDVAVAKFLQGGFEAGLVGGLADWFAVTALFRHPMGIPIPHTALLPKNRKRITDALVHTLENDWLNKESIEEKIKQIRITEKVLTLLEKEVESPQVRSALVSISEQVVQQIDIEPVLPVIESKLKEYIKSINTAGLLHGFIDKALGEQYEEKAFDFLLGKVSDWAVRSDTRHKLGSMALQALENIELDGFMQFALKSFAGMLNEDKLGGVLQTLLLRGSDDLRRPENKNRQVFLAYVRREIEEARESEGLLATFEKWKYNLAEEVQLHERLSDIAEDLRKQALEFIRNDAYLDDFALPFLRRLIQKVRANEEMMVRFEVWLQRQIAVLVEQNHSKIGKLVRENLDKLDNETLIEMMEDKIGKDIQWIRVNGAVCGFLIGLVLVTIKSFIL
ncbi:hypothetical protein AM501_22550 [Aneurinibacillus migulanus]|uniref:DUF445 domain-containing protein n=1 Tax=Aneurinibacillus migulanus TaxID=47500 RepID=UPI0005BC1876|nr:DUF445 domain-containing protein [Aneurinibacillus migulanus]KIV55197.1 hypothetical protein TS64_13170 [Aneurinibacillus migulanus]KPD06027.1 hypothetical protein AM501_22550 [Aneurinibacillus migulanus]MCP1355998.1 DUF445 domain-containing protein [Aneurinibacillus migulanus]CEH29625.1 Uncharacterized protein BN1090_A2_02064 [Aneurinibacillus migulanus]